MGAFTKSYGAGGFDGYLVKLDSNGNKLWQKTNGSSEGETLYFLDEHPHGGFVGIGDYKETPNGDIDFRLMRFDESLNLKWEKVFGEPKVDQTRLYPLIEPDGSIIFGGDFADTSRPNDALSGVLYKADSSGNILWERQYTKYSNSNDNHYLTTLNRSLDGDGYLLYGLHTDHYDHGQGGQNLWLLKVDSMGCDTAGCAKSTLVAQHRSPKEGALKLFPSPVKKHLRVERSSEAPENSSYRIYDARGRVVKEGFPLSGAACRSAPCDRASTSSRCARRRGA